METILRRGRLLRELAANADKKLFLVIAPAGYGKTELIRSYLSETEKPSLTFPLLPSADGQGDLLSFIANLIASCRGLSNKFGRKVLDIIETIRQNPSVFSNTSVISETLAKHFCCDLRKYFKSGLIIHLEDLHVIDTKQNRWLAFFLDELLERLPMGCILLISSRNKPELNIEKFASAGQILIIEADKLLFDFSEIKELMTENYGMKPDADDINYMEDRFNGWIAGIILAIGLYGGRSWRRPSFRPAFRRTTGEVNQSVFNYFAGEIFDKLEDSLKDFLIRTALTDYFNVELCREALGIKNAEIIIRQIIRDNLFIRDFMPAGEPSVTKSYAYHSLYREFLLSRLDSHISESSKNELLAKVSAYYLKRKNPDNAVMYAFKAKDYRLAAWTVRSFLRKKQNLVPHISQISLWLSMFPAEILNNNHHLLYYKAYECFLSSRFDDACKIMDNLLEKCRRNNDAALYEECLIAKAEFDSYVGHDLKRCIDFISGLLGNQYPEKIRGHLLFCLGRAHFNNRDIDSSIRRLSESLRICRKGKFSTLQNQARDMLARCYLARGEHTRATDCCEQILSSDPHIYQRFMAMNKLVENYRNLGEFDMAKEFLDRAKSCLDYLPNEFSRLYCCISEVLLRYQVGDFEEAKRILKQGLEIALKSKHRFYIYWCYFYMANSYAALKNIIPAENYSKLAMQYAGDEETKLAVQHCEAQLKIERGKYQNVERILLQVSKYSRQEKIIQAEATNMAVLADYYIKTGEPEKAYLNIKESLRMLKEHNLYAFFLNDVPVRRDLFDYALQNSIEPDTVKLLQKKYFELQRINWLSENYKKRLRSEREKFFDVKMIAFGGLVFKLRGANIEGKTFRQKSKLFLAYLVLKKKCTKDKLIDLFLRDIPLEKANLSFHQAVSNLRKILKLKYIDIISYENGILSLNPMLNFTSDLEEFDACYEMFFSKPGSPSQKIDTATNAVCLYSGDALEGFYENWCEDLREEYLQKYVRFKEELTDLLLKERRFEEASEHAQTVLKIDPLNEQVNLMYIESLVRIGRRSEARRFYHKMIQTFERETGEKPPPSVINRAERILQ